MFPWGVSCGYMKKINIKSKRDRRGVLKGYHVNKLVVKPLIRKTKQYSVGCLKQGCVLLEKLEEIDEAIAIIAWEVARQVKGANKSQPIPWACEG